MLLPVGQGQVQWCLLSSERQLTFDGIAEPIPDTRAPEPEELPRQPESPAQGSLSLGQPLQLPMPLEPRHPLGDDGFPCAECLSGWSAAMCAHHPTAKVKPNPSVCGNQNCESSAPKNTSERARDAWDGTNDDLKKRRGLRHFGEVDWGVFVFTLPEELRPLLVGDKVGEFQRAGWDLITEILSRVQGPLKFYGRCYLHPVGEPQLPPDVPENEQMPVERSTVYKPHANYIVPLIGLGADGTAHRLRKVLPKSWFGTEGWVQARWRDLLVEMFGQWWSGEPPVTNWFYEFRSEDQKKRHALKYFGRVFPGWGGHKQVSVRPRSYGLAHSSRLADLELLTAGVPERPEWGACQSCVEEGLPLVPRLTAERLGFERRMVRAMRPDGQGWSYRERSKQEEFESVTSELGRELQHQLNRHRAMCRECPPSALMLNIVEPSCSTGRLDPPTGPPDPYMSG